MAPVFKTMTFRPARREGESSVASTQGLDGRLLVHAKNRGVLGWIQVQTDNVGRLDLKVGIVRCHVAVQTMGFESGPFPDPGHQAVVDLELAGQLARAPMSRAVRWFAKCPTQNAGLQTRRTHTRALTSMTTLEPWQTVLQKAPLPQTHCGRVATQSPLDIHVRKAFRKEQNHLASANLSCRQCPTSPSLLQLS